jgi:hypothetical protein
LAGGDAQAKRELLKRGIEEMTLHPEELRVEIRYRVPDFIVIKMVAGARYQSIHNKIKAWLIANLRLSPIGRHLLVA